MNSPTTLFKPTTFLFTFLALIALVTQVSCSDDDDNQGQNNDALIADIEETMSSGTWRISNYNDSGTDETSDYDGFSFTFNSDGSLVATNGTDTYNGTWSVTDDDDSSDDNSSGEDDIDFNIFFSSPEIMAELTDDWDIESWSTSRLALSDVSGGDGTTDLLTFEKN